ncbi:MAG TPA: hypothetical protein VF635_11785, partial [Propionibacteriaceae bacterium]
MAEDDRRGDGDRGGSHDVGPTGPGVPNTGEGRGAPLGIGQWSYADEDATTETPAVGGYRAADTQPLPVAPPNLYRGIYDAPPGGSSSAGSSWPGQSWGAGQYSAPLGGAPTPVPSPGSGASAPYSPVQPQRRRFRGASVIVPAAVTALLIGGAAGYGGSRLAERTEAVPQSSTAPPSAGPSASGVPSAP